MTYLIHSVTATLLTVVFFSLLKNGETISCYNCNSIMNEDCASNWEKIGSTECVNGTTIPPNIFPKAGITGEGSRVKNIADMDSRIDDLACYKIITEVNGKQETFRGCIIKNLGIIACKKIGEYKEVDACNVCNNNGCNSSSTMSLNLILMVVPLFLGYRLSR